MGKEGMRDGYRLALGPTMRDHSFVVWAFQTSVRGTEESFIRSVFMTECLEGPGWEADLRRVLGSTANVCLENLLSGSPEWEVKRSPCLSPYQA